MIMADLPDISPDLDQPLPQVDPNSDLVPYRIARTDPGQDPVITTGYGPRARLPIQPPGGGGVGAPDLTGLLGEAMQHLPVDQAIKAAEAATRFIGQRGYMRDIQSGQNAAQAFAKWGPMLFHQATGIPEAIDRSVPTPITPQQLIQNKLNQQKFEASQAAAKVKLDAASAKAAAGEVRAVGGELYRIKPNEPPEKLVTKSKPELTPEQKTDLTDAYRELDSARKDQAKLDPGNLALDKGKKGMEHQEAVLRAGKRVFDARQRINKIVGAPVSPALSVQPTTSAAISPQEFVPDTSQPAPAPTSAVGIKTPTQGAIPTTPTDFPNPARRKQPTQGTPIAQEKITTKEQYDALPSGTVYVGKDGKRYKKP